MTVWVSSVTHALTLVFLKCGETGYSHQQPQWQCLSGRHVILDVPTAREPAELG